MDEAGKFTSLQNLLHTLKFFVKLKREIYFPTVKQDLCLYI